MFKGYFFIRIREYDSTIWFKNIFFTFYVYDNHPCFIQKSSEIFLVELSIRDYGVLGGRERRGG